MILNYSVIGINSASIANLDSKISRFENLTKVGHALNPNGLFDTIVSRSPDLIFVEVTNYTLKDYIDLRALIDDLYRSFPKKPFLVAYSDTEMQAYNCIKNNFFYYLVQPFAELQFQKMNYKLNNALSQFPNKNPQKICLKTYRDYRFVEIADIVYLKSDNNTSEFFLSDQSKINAFKTLKHFQNILPNSFHRIHQSYIINQKYISRIHFGKAECHLKPLQKSLPFSKSYRAIVNEIAASLLGNALT